MEEFLITLISTLNDIEVKGTSNMDSLLGCIPACEHELAKIQAENATGEDGEIDGEQIDKRT